jgi:hypothetical protein
MALPPPRRVNPAFKSFPYNLWIDRFVPLVVDHDWLKFAEIQMKHTSFGYVGCCPAPDDIDRSRFKAAHEAIGELKREYLPAMTKLVGTGTNEELWRRYLAYLFGNCFVTFDNFHKFISALEEFRLMYMPDNQAYVVMVTELKWVS